ncbi:MAG TPA: hypothetical protein PLP66_07700 [Phycisphaerae bacterium]|nr:hypothetical protein [Phycisphaerae bacterium]HPM23775.1 hypothetical protein [Phycisphaerae bacterium]
MNGRTSRWAGLAALSGAWLLAGSCAAVPNALKAVLMAVAFVDALA